MPSLDCDTRRVSLEVLMTHDRRSIARFVFRGGRFASITRLSLSGVDEKRLADDASGEFVDYFAIAMLQEHTSSQG